MQLTQQDHGGHYGQEGNTGRGFQLSVPSPGHVVALVFDPSGAWYYAEGGIYDPASGTTTLKLFKRPGEMQALIEVGTLTLDPPVPATGPRTMRAAWSFLPGFSPRPAPVSGRFNWLML
jgi:hypothetical protein